MLKILVAEVVDVESCSEEPDDSDVVKSLSSPTLRRLLSMSGVALEAVLNGELLRFADLPARLALPPPVQTRLPLGLRASDLRGVPEGID